MKKIYSIVLMAAALLVGTNVNAAVTSYAELQAAFAPNQTGDVINIQLGSSIELDYTVYIRDGKHYVLDMNGCNLTASFIPNMTYKATTPVVPSMFYVLHGTLEIINSKETGGNILHDLSTSAPTKEPIVIVMTGMGYTYTGSDYEEVPNVKISKEKVATWSNLIIGKGVNINAKGEGARGKGITVYRMGNNEISSTGYMTNNIVDPATGEKGLKIYDAGAEFKYVTNKNSNATTLAKGVNVLVKEGASVRGGEYGIQVSGVVAAKDSAYRPNIIIEKGAKVEAHETEIGATAVYSAGYGDWTIDGEVAGSTGVYVKGGTVNVNENANIYSTNTTHSDPICTTSGVKAGGSAIVYESNQSYVGDININVNGGTIGSATSGGYAIEGSKRDGANLALDVLDIQGGTLVAGGEGAVETAALQSAIEQGATFVVDGATINTDATDLQDLNTLLTLAGNSTIIAQTEDAEGNTVYVIEEKEDKTTPVTADINVTGGTAYVEWDAAPLDAQITIPEADVKYFSMQSGTLTIPAGKTLKAGSIVLGANAVIDVKAGGKLVITGDNGLVANQKTNIKIAYQNGASGLFYLAPIAKANKNPGATVELTTQAYKNGDKYVFERMGIPAVDGMKLTDIVKVTSTVGITGLYWDIAIQNWKQLTGTQVIPPFMGIAFTNAATAPGNQYNFPCRLMGNANADLEVSGQWAYFANSYMANVDLLALTLEIFANVTGMDAGVHMDPQGIEKWDAISKLDLEQGMADATIIKPMQGFILKRDENAADATVTVNYQTMVWNPVFVPSNKAARNRAVDENLTRVKITVTNENGVYDNVTLRQSDKYTADRDNGGDMEKYMSAVGANLYAVSNELGNMAQIATDNIDGMILGVSANKNEACKMTFSHVCGEQMAIRDNLTGATITMVEGAEYFFTATEGDNANRFEIIAVKNAPTDVETVVETAGAKAVYTVLGQYMGTTDNWNTLPNGIYVVDGVKMVK